MMIFTIIGHNAVRVNMGAKWDKSHHYYINLRTMAIFMPAELLFVYESSYLYISVPICNQSSYLYISVPICTSEFLFL